MPRVLEDVPSIVDIENAKTVFDAARDYTRAAARFHRASEIVEHEGRQGTGVLLALAEMAASAATLAETTIALKAQTPSPPPHLDWAVEAARLAVLEGIRGLDGSHRLARKAVAEAPFFARIHPPRSDGSIQDRLVVGAWEAAFGGGVLGVERRDWHRPGSPAADHTSDLRPMTFHVVTDTRLVHKVPDTVIAALTGPRSAAAVERSRMRYRRRVAVWKAAKPYQPWWDRPEARAAQTVSMWIWAFAQLPRRSEWPTIRWPLSLMAP